ncbi:MAG TPA: alpha-L-arabinofuranosidase C-terminal domain-containing protein, partial [Halanaerobiales bacterium]|nr:alpha-L-arabinofuranosidase C-terminal domain-containing protein [Halanaerobiales bacterium]
LYQQNSLRDALIAGINLNIFNNNCERVQMANIAQIVNVLQALILTRGKEMILTPTYHVFDLYKVHQNAELLDFELKCESYEVNGDSIPALSASVSEDREGSINITFCNLNAERSVSLEGILNSCEPDIDTVMARVLTAGKVNAHNTFKEADRVKPEPFNKIKLKGNGFEAELPPASVVLLRLE